MNFLTKNININTIETRTVIVYLVCVFPLLFNIPLWVIGATFILFSWHLINLWLEKNKFENKYIDYSKKTDTITKTVINCIAIGFFILIGFNFYSLGVLGSITSHMLIMTTLQLHETRRGKKEKRPYTIISIAFFFVVLLEFLYSQEIWTIVYLFLATFLIIGLTIDIIHKRQPLKLKEDVKITSQLMTFSLPIMLLLFIFFPRIEGPLWGFEQLTDQGKTGLSDTMTPGDISDLIMSYEPAFRVNFDNNKIPPRSTLYWRAFVLDKFSDGTWYRSPDSYNNRLDISYQSKSFQYNIVIEPQTEPILYSLDAPFKNSIPKGANLQGDLELINENVVSNKKFYTLSSATDYILEPKMSPSEKDKYLELPENKNPKTIELAQKWKENGLSNQEIINKALNRYKQNNYTYTLSPPKLEGNTVDKFLFETKKGFCEHYSSSFAILMRAAGIPSRVVTGYQGGDINNIGNYLVVRQSNAHAWNEVWLENKGWVRYDPTSMVSPNRIDQGSLRNAFNDQESINKFNKIQTFDFPFAKSLNNTMDWVGNSWDQWFLGYDKEKQKSFLKSFGITNIIEMIFYLVFSIITLFVLSFFILKIFRFKTEKREKAVTLWKKLNKKLEKAGFIQSKGESSTNFIERVCKSFPYKKYELKKINEYYLSLRYEYLNDDESKILENKLEKAIKQLNL